MDILQQLKKPLNISEVDFRIQSINNGGYATILAYKDARVDMNRLDEVCGMNWQKDYKTIDDNLYCGVGIKYNDEWLWRWDVGTESFSDKEKGQASDAFKRACFNWGIGRELYNYPRIQVKLFPEEFTKDNNKVKQTYELNLDKWIWNAVVSDSGSVTSLKATDEKGRERFNYNAVKPLKRNYKQEIEKAASLDDLKSVWTSIPAGTEKDALNDLKEQIKQKLTPKSA